MGRFIYGLLIIITLGVIIITCLTFFQLRKITLFNSSLNKFIAIISRYKRTSLNQEIKKIDE